MVHYRFERDDRRLRMRTPPPDRIIVADDLFQFGIEEEYFLSDAQTLQAASRTPDALFQSADFGIAGHVGREFLQAQIEVATEPQVRYCRTIISGGTSADAQLQIFAENEHGGAEFALHKVSRWIRDATLALTTAG